MIEWKNTSTYGQHEPQEQRVPRRWNCNIGNLDITLHRHLDYPPDVWLLKCSYLVIAYRLENTDLEKAKAEAIDWVKSKLKRQITEYSMHLELLEREEPK